MPKPPMLCVPCGGSMPTRFFMFTQEWTPPGERWQVDATPNRLDVSRSILIDRAMNLGRPIWQWDSDCVAFQQPYEEALTLIEKDIRQGFDAVVAPHSTGGKVNILPLDREAVGPRPTEPFEIIGGFNGAWYMSLGGLAKLKDIGWWKFTDGNSIPMYCTFGLPGPDPAHPDIGTTEDFDLSIRFRAQGGRICCDPRLKVAHLNKRDEVVDVQTLNRMEAEQRAAVEGREKKLREKWTRESRDG